ncbi:hypothetical protein [Paraburkholderia phytofirmans]|uniref:Lipoprotein n=1 Tax=Paraburkholderia phytofirmans (strain DSM 17436 / LMG 22146 / PsJN) TaxID=398527 RepID=B2TDS8_PARPJ|nr:hypothetical protein [Paraburkholderia phytofirmans]ACD19118.1 conserved hypothetical protein [Paraburkholderia phytofirmans PsJN]
MKEENRGFEINQLRFVFPFTLLLASLLCACGGGSSPSSAPAANLSAAQQNYENFTLASNGGQHFVTGLLSFSTSSGGAPTLNTATSYFFTRDSSLAQSPAVAGPQRLTTGTSTIDPALGVPAAAGQRYLVNGSVVVEAIPAQVQVSYSGANVEETDLASDGKTVTMTLRGTSYTTVPLSGAISNSPSELFNGSALGIVTNTINGNSLYNRQASWQTGAAYLKVVREVVGDTVVAGDCALPNTTGPNLTPCVTTASTLEGFFPHTSSADNTTYNLSDGQIVTLAGTRAWVANVASNSATTQYRVYFQNNGQIFSGDLIKDATTLGTYPLGSSTPQNFYIFLNSVAVQSVKSAITF